MRMCEVEQNVSAAHVLVLFGVDSDYRELVATVTFAFVEFFIGYVDDFVQTQQTISQQAANTNAYGETHRRL